MKLNALLINLLFILTIGFIIKNLYSLVKYLRANRNLSAYDFIYDAFLFVVYGLLIFAFSILYWMYFDDNRVDSGRIIITYLFSGSVLILCLFMTLIRFQQNSIIRIITGLFVIILVFLLIKYHPLPEYFSTSSLFGLSNFWIFQLIIPSVILPLLLSFFLIFKTIVKRNNSQKKFKLSLKIPYTRRLSFPFAYFLAFAGFFLGISGFMAMPVIAGAKLLYRNQYTGAPTPVKIGTFLGPDFSYPFFLGIISIGLILWFIIDNKKDGYEPKRHFSFFPVILCCSALFFVILNYGTNNPDI